VLAVRPRIPLFVPLLWLLATACRPAAPRDPGIHQELIPHRDDPQKQVELLWARPDYDGRFPAIVYLHGHQYGERPGGATFATWGILARTARSGAVALAVSQPGYGRSDGPPDYCGPFTQRAVETVLARIRTWPFVDPAKIAVYGVSRGAIVAAMLTTRDSRLAAAVLMSGTYDLGELYRRISAPSETRFLLTAIAANLRHETDASEEAFRARSALAHAATIRTPTLLLNGALDDRFDPSSARRLGAAILANGVPAKVVVFPDLGHKIPIEVRGPEIVPFLARHLGVALE